MTRIDLTKSLTPQTIAQVLEYLESRPLKEVYGLFQNIVSQLEDKDANGQSNIRSDANTPGSGNGSLGGRGVPALALEQGSSGVESGVENVHGRDEPLRSGS